jgi:magnesium chelatase subunit I
VKDDPFNSHKSDLDLMGNEVKSAIQNNESIETELIKIPMIDLPLGATEDRVCGTIDIEKALTEGIKAFEPGLLAKANRGLLYVEVNLLDDHLVDILLDSAASVEYCRTRRNFYQTSGTFVLVDQETEEGELRPQLLDRFGMHAEIRTVKDPILRVKVVEERTSFDQNPMLWIENYESQQQELRDKIVAAQNYYQVLILIML